jgi:hypothetical protein
VGFLMAAIMAVSSIVTVILLPAIMTHIERWLSPKKKRVPSAEDYAATKLAANKERTL